AAYCARCPSPVFFSSRRRHTRFSRDWSSDVCSSDLVELLLFELVLLLAEAGGLGGDVHALGVGLDGTHGAADLDLDALLNLAKEIGRASCRDRGESARGPASLHCKHAYQHGAR